MPDDDRDGGPRGNSGPAKPGSVKHTGAALPLSIALVLLIGAAFSALSFGIVRTLENERIAADVENSAANRVSTIQSALLQQQHLLESVGAYFRASPQVTRESFAAFVAPLLPHSPQLQAIGYSPYVLLADRDTVEQMAVARYDFDDFQIRERDTDGQLRPAGSRDAYAPILFMEPMTGNEAAVGFDLLSEPNRRMALEAARDSGEPRTTTRLRLVQDSLAQVGFLSALPIYRPGAPLQTVVDRREALQGFVTHVYRIEELIDSGLSPLRPGGIDIFFYDPSGPPDDGPIYVHQSRTRDSADLTANEGMLNTPVKFVHEGRLDIGGREWRVTAGPAPGFVAARRGVLSWVLLVVGLMATILLASYLHATAKRERILQRALDELEVSEARLRYVLENMPVLMSAYDIEGNLIVWNRECERVTGYAAKEVLGKRKVPNLNIPEPAGHHREDQDARESGDFRGRERTLRAKDGFDRTIAWSNVSNSIPVSGWDCWLIGIDVSERKRADAEREAIQAQLLSSQKLESLGVMAGGIAHDFNNLLTAIMGNASLAKEAVPERSPAHSALSEIISASDRAAILTQQMLAYAGQTTIQTTPVDLSEHVRDIESLLRAAISKKTELCLDLAEGLPAVDADPSQIQQLILNLVVNGSESCVGQAGSVNVRTGVLDVDAQYLISAGASGDLEPGTYVYVEVSDDGRGMDAQTQEHIFDPFFSTKFAGRGLGLAAALGIVRSHKGSIKVYSTPGEGSVFEVLLPASSHDASLPGEDTAVRASDGRMILVVDDEPMILKLVRNKLEKLGYRVLAADGGRTAIDIFKDNRDEVDCVLLDMTMPDLDGFETYRELRKIRTDVVVVLSSGYSEVSATQRVGSDGLAGFLQKPYTSKVLAAKIKEVIEEQGRDVGER